MNKQRPPFFPLIILFIILNIFFLTSTNFLAKWGIDKDILVIANSLFFILSMLTFMLHKKAMNNKNPHVFVRSVMGGMMVKMIICAIAVLTYVLLNRETYNKRGVLVAMLLYLVYLAVEVCVLLKLNKQKNA